MSLWSCSCAGKLGVHLFADSSGILKLDKAESVIEVWESYEVDVPVVAPKENLTIEAREALETDPLEQVSFKFAGISTR